MRARLLVEDLQVRLDRLRPLLLRIGVGTRGTRLHEPRQDIRRLERLARALEEHAPVIERDDVVRARRAQLDDDATGGRRSARA